MEARGLRGPGTAALVVAACLATAGLWSRGAEVVGIDFYQFWAVARAARVAGPVDPYSPAGDERIAAVALAHSADTPYRATAARYRRVLETYGSPLLYASFVPLAWSRYDAALLAFQAVSLLAAVGGLYFVARAAGLSPPVSIALAAALAEWSEPLYADTSVANVGRLQLACLCAVLVLLATGLRERYLAAGVVLALAVAFKPNLLLAPAALAAALVLRRARREVLQLALGLVVGAAAGVAAAAALGFAPRMWPEWIRAVQAMPESQITLALGNYAPRRLVAEAVGRDPMVLTAILAGLVLLAAVWRSRAAVDAERAFEEQRAVAAGSLAYLLAGRLVWTHYSLLALPAAVLVLGHDRERAGFDAVAVLVALGLTATRPILAVTGGGPLAEAVLLDLSLVVIAVALLRTRAPRPDPA